MREVSNRVVAILIVVLIIMTLLQITVYNIRYKEITFKAATAVGFVGMCIDNNPIIIPIPDQTAFVNVLYTYDVNTTVSNDENVTFYDDTVLFEIDNQTGFISFMPDAADEGIYYINISVVSNCGILNDIETFKLTVEPQNNPPVLDYIPDFSIYQNQTLTYDVNATDPDNDELTFGDNTTMFDIDPDTGFIYFAPIQNDVGNTSVLIWVMDEHGLIDWQVVIFEVIDTNDPPLLWPIGAQTAEINETFMLKVNATDIDVKPEWNNLTFYDNATFFDINISTGWIIFDALDEHNGTYWINISVTDDTYWDWEVISFTVTDINHPPNITSWYPYNYTIEMDEGEYQYFNITKYDQDGTIPSTQWYLDHVLLPEETNDEYIYYAGYWSAGTHNVTVIITDGILNDLHNWTVIVHDVPEPDIGGPTPPAAAPPPCVENWRCSEWSVCPVYEIQTRECVDLNKCGTEFYKPEDTRSCVYVPEPGCEDGIVNCHHGSCEIWVDCGGPCPPCPTCSDGIKNCHTTDKGTKLCEDGIDCGGPCPPCPEEKPPVCGDGICEIGELFTCIQDCWLFFAQFLLVVIILGAVSIFLYRLSSLIVVFYRKKIKPPPYTNLELLGASTLKKLHMIQLEIGKKRVKTVVSEFSEVMRDFFANRFNIRKKFTYIELTEVARRRKIESMTAERITQFSVKMTEIEYKLTEPAISDIALTVKNAIIIVERLTGVKMRDIFEKRAEEEFKRAEPVEEKVELPKPPPEKKKPRYKMTERDIANVKTLEKLISDGEKALANNKIDEAEKVYTKIRKIYDDIHPDVKKGLYNETIRIIKLYNEIMKEIK